jgi:hypothetical protein
MQDITELIELLDRADRVREEIENSLQLVKFRLHISGALISRRSGQLAEAEDMVARSRALPARTTRRRAAISEFPTELSTLLPPFIQAHLRRFRRKPVQGGYRAG